MNNKKDENQSTLSDKILSFIMELIAILAGFCAAWHVYCLLMEGMYFANAGFWNCAVLALSSVVGFVGGGFYAFANSSKAKLNPFQWINILLPAFGMLGGYVGITFVVCDFLGFFGDTLWKFGFIVSALGLLILWKFVLHEILYCLLFCWLPFNLRPIPHNGRIAYHMFTRTDDVARKRFGRAGSVYALKCAQRASAFYERKIKKRTPQVHQFYYYYETIEFVICSYWDGTIEKRDAAKAVSYAEKALALSKRLRNVSGDTCEDNGLYSFDANDIPTLFSFRSMRFWRKRTAPAMA